MADPGSLIKELCEETTCPVCLEYFTDPVITECGHNFCRAFLTQSWVDPGTNPSCPECREPVQQNNLRPSRKLANIAEISKKSNIQKMKGNEGEEGACEMHQEPLNFFCKYDKAHICVVCKKSKEHREHQVITLEEAAKEYQNIGVCEKHQKPLKLFCREDEDEASICVLCNQEHYHHEVIPVEEAAEEYKKKIQDLLRSLEKKRKKMERQNVAEEQKNQERLKEMEAEKQKITSFFKQMHRFLDEKECFWLKYLADLEKEMKKRQEENLTRLSKEILHFSDLIKDIEGKCQQPPSSFLHDIRGTVKRCQEKQKELPLELSSGLEWRLRKDSLKTSVLKEVIEEIEESLKGGLSLMSVTLDPDTANPYLVVPANQKSVKMAYSYQNVPDNPERFLSMRCVLGCERFTSGKHCWEVSVEPWMCGKEQWAVGVARDTVQRKKEISFSPKNGIWVVGKDPYNHAFCAYNFPANTPLPSGSRDVWKIQVFLDYEEGCVEFVDAETGNWLFSFPKTSFSREVIRPFFWVSNASLKC